MENTKNTENTVDTGVGSMPLDTAKHSPCNTIKAGAKVIRNRNWTFTWNNYSEKDIEYLLNGVCKESERFVFQEETGESGTKHLQGVICFKSARTFPAMKKKLPVVHLEPVKQLKAAIKYCSKEDTKTGERYHKGIPELRVLRDPLSVNPMLPWQSTLAETLSREPDDRTIIWINDKVGNNGKTVFAKHLCIKYPNEVLYVGGKASDIKYAVALFNKTKILRIAIFDLTRSLEKFVSYEAIEAIKNGIFFSGKYESEQVLFDSPHVVILANFKPEFTKLSMDRWKYYKIVDKKLIERTY